MDADEKMMYLDTLKEGVTPFDRFVSRADMKDVVDIPEPRKLIDGSILRLLKMINNDHTTRFLPVYGSAGTGKTHLYWALKEREDDFGCYIVYVPSPPAPVRMLFHIYSCIMNELGDVILKKIGSSMVKKYGGSHRSIDPLGVFKVKRSAHEIQRLARKDFTGLQSEFVKTLIRYKMKALHWKLAERWLLGEALMDSDLLKLSLSRVIEEDDICIAALKVISKQSDRPIIFYFDELEIPYNSYGAEAEIRLMSIHKRMYNEISNSLIIVACLSEIWPRITQITDSAMKSRMEMELELHPFTLEDTKKLYIKAMETFWDENNIPSPPDPYFPLKEGVFKIVFEKTKGNPRDSIKMTKVFIDQILYDEELFDHLQEKIDHIERGRAEASTPGSIAPTTHIPESGESAPSTLHDMGEKVLADLDQIIDAAVKKKEEEFEAEMAEQIEVTPATTVSAAIDSILYFTKEHGTELKVDFDYEFTVSGKNKSISAVILDLNGQKIGIDIPTIKSFNKSGGVAAYYSVNRLKQALTGQNIDKACLIVPRGTSGKKFSMILEELSSKLTLVELDETEAKSLIRNAKNNPSIKGREFARLIFTDISLEPPTPESEENSDRSN